MDRVATNLLERLHSIYDRAPGKALALRIRRDGGLQWRINDYTLTLSGLSGVTEWDLRGTTIGHLSDLLVVAGYQIAYRNPDLDHLLAIVLMPGHGDQDRSNGDHVYAYTALLWDLLGASGLAYEDARTAVQAALRQLILPQSTHEWADLFGTIFGIPRDPGETDAIYTQRIIWEVQRHRSNPASISNNILYRTGYDIAVREPWKEIFVLSESPMDDDFHLQGAPIWQYHTAQLIATSGVRWAPVVKEAMADRPAGTIYLDPASHYPPSIIPVPDIGIIACQESVRAGQIWALEGVLSVNLDLSNYRVVENHQFVIYEVVLLLCGPPAGVPIWSNPDPDLLLWTGNWDTRTWQQGYERLFYPPINEYAGIVMLSDAAAMGDLQCHFAGSMPVEVGDPMMLSDITALSDYEYHIDQVPIDVWEDALRSAATTALEDVSVGLTIYSIPL